MLDDLGQVLLHALVSGEEVFHLAFVDAELGFLPLGLVLGRLHDLGLAGFGLQLEQFLLGQRQPFQGRLLLAGEQLGIAGANRFGQLADLARRSFRAFIAGVQRLEPVQQPFLLVVLLVHDLLGPRRRGPR